MVRVFRHYISPVKLTLMGVDFLLMFLTAYVLSGAPALVAAFGLDAVDLTAHYSAFMLCLAAFIYASVVGAGMLSIGCYASKPIRFFSNFCLRFFLILVAAVLLFAAAGIWVEMLHRFTALFAATLAVTIILLPTVRLIILSFVAKISLTMKIVLIGNEKCFEIEEKIKDARELGIEIAGIICMEESHLKGHEDNPKAIAFSAVDNLKNYSRGVKADALVVVGPAKNHNLAKEQLIACKLDGIVIQDLTSFYEQALGYVDLESLEKEWIIYADGFKGSSFLEHGIKRGFDLMVSLLVLLLASPLMLLAALLVKATSQGPVFYVQERVGLMGKTFNLIKFRTMSVTAESAGPQFAAENDPRVTAIGRFLRRSRIDELPQLINVLKGDMSFVGPRPERPFFVDQFAGSIPFYRERHYVKPGITGWAQLRYPYGASEEDTRRKLEYDLYYLKNYSLFLDVLIIIQTVRVVVFPEGVR